MVSWKRLILGLIVLVLAFFFWGELTLFTGRLIQVIVFDLALLWLFLCLYFFWRYNQPRIKR